MSAYPNTTGPTRADLEAARSLLGKVGQGRTNAKVDGLEGADLCIHSLTGSGRDLAEHDYGDFYLSPEARAQWEASPYRHHVFTENSGSTVRMPPYCICGNGEGVKVHQRCWAGELK